ncbi:hypothetical protein BCL76_103282 [Streptomyces sp. CG 926]|uniref:hypothetical protein n=1 Tax=Streptomyces sp. CG 926 TaxID=1882405 RepID=UPI000D6D1EBA|nr:hypothetical protein [Streptomyces sp. CG 926]PWK72053.1 hypothetical protein BCL76_103282 [Streptomyces sp. CG 926]
MYSPKDETTRARMEAALATASSHLATAPRGPLSWGWLGRTIGSRTESGHWLRVHCGEAAKTPTTRNEGIALAEERVSDKVSRPHLHDLYRWEGGDYVFEAELIDYIAQPVISPETPDLTEDPELPNSWWTALRESLDALSSAEPPRETIRQSWADRVFPEFLGIPAPAITDRVTGHADLQWANLTHHPLVILDWERWGAVPVGYDPAMLYVNSLRVPAVAERIRTEFADVLDTPAGRIGEQIALAEMLQAVGRGWYVELAPLLRQRAEGLTGVLPPVAETGSNAS